MSSSSAPKTENKKGDFFARPWEPPLEGDSHGPVTPSGDNYSDTGGYTRFVPIPSPNDLRLSLPLMNLIRKSDSISEGERDEMRYL